MVAILHDGCALDLRGLHWEVIAALSVFPLPLDAISKQVLNPGRVSTDSFPVFVFHILVVPVFVVVVPVFVVVVPVFVIIVPIFVVVVPVFVIVIPVFFAIITLIAVITFITIIAVVTVIAVIAIIAVVAVIIVIAITFIVFDEMDTDEDDSVVVFS